MTQKIETLNQNLNDSRNTDVIKAWIAVCVATCDVHIKRLGKPTTLFEMSRSKYFNLKHINAYKVGETPGRNVLVIDYNPVTVPQIDMKYMRGLLDFSIRQFTVSVFVSAGGKRYQPGQTINGIVLSKFQRLNGWNNHGYLIPLQPR
jgi:hypothetical protein